MSLASTLLDQVRTLAAIHGAVVVHEIHLQVGPLSGVEAELLSSAWARSSAGTEMAGAQLYVSEVPLEAVCRSCGTSFEVAKFDFCCALCGSCETEVVRGDGVMLQSITLDEPPCGVAR